MAIEVFDYSCGNGYDANTRKGPVVMSARVP
jgi:hypothetical protein